MAVDFGRKLLIQDGQDAPIDKFEVRFATPWGLYESFDEAVNKCREIDMDPTLVIQPFVAVIDKAGRIELWVRK